MYLQNIMTNYLNESNASITNDFNPISPKQSDWLIEEKRIIKTYTFKDKKFLEAFIVELIKYNRESSAIVEFRVKENKVGVIIHATAPELTEIEFEAKIDVSKIKRDVMYYYAK